MNGHEVGSGNNETSQKRKILVVTVCFLPIVVFSVYHITREHTGFWYVAFQIMFSWALAMVIPLLCYLRGNALERQQKLLKSIENDELGKTAHSYAIEVFLRRVSGERLLTARGFSIPIIFLSSLIAIASFLALYGANTRELLEIPNLFLGGFKVTEIPSEFVTVLDDLGLLQVTDLLLRNQIYEYQSITLLMISMAALGSYVIIVLRLSNRINNFDIDPISFYFFSIHLTQAVIVAAVVRHVIPSVMDDSPTFLLAGIGFAIGLQPDIFLGFLARLGRNKVGVAAAPRQTEPDETLRPSNFSLILLEGMTHNVRRRMEEMAIDNCQILANCNPYAIWARTAYQMHQVVDWIAQAQLCILVDAEGLKKLRPYGVRDIFGFHVAASGQATGELANILGMPAPVLEKIAENLGTEPSFTKLLEVRLALRASRGGEP